MTETALANIKVNTRFRKDPGNLEALVKSIQEIGLLHPVVISYEDELIAGWRRLEACKKLGWNRIPVTRVPLKELAKGEFHENFVRKDFTVSEMVAIKRALEPEFEGRQGRPEKGAESAPLGKSREVVASYIGVSHDTLTKAEMLVDAAQKDPERFAATLESVDNGDTSLNYAYSMVKRAEFQKLDTPPLPEGKFDIIYADPPWQTHSISGRGTPEHHYPTMTPEQIAAVQVPCTENAILFMWVAPSMIREALYIVDSWGFKYKNHLIWVKDRFGTGFYFRVQHELLFLCTRGEVLTPLEHDRPSSILQSPMREHSQKPEEIYAIIERMYPKRKYLELFARNKREGWESWGNQISIEH